MRPPNGGCLISIGIIPPGGNIGGTIIAGLGNIGKEGSVVRDVGWSDAELRPGNSGRPGNGGNDSGPGLEAPGRPGKLSRLGALPKPLPTTGSLFVDPRSMLTVSVKSDFSCSSA